jgi:hypothetical protein
MATTNIATLLNQAQSMGINIVAPDGEDVPISSANVDIFLLQVFLDKTYSLDAQIKSMMTGADYRKQISVKLQKRVDYLQKVLGGDASAIDPDTGTAFSDGHDLGASNHPQGVTGFMAELNGNAATNITGDRVNSKAALVIKGEMERVQGMLRQSNQESDRDSLYLQQLSAQKNVAMSTMTSYLKEKTDVSMAIARNM